MSEELVYLSASHPIFFGGTKDVVTCALDGDSTIRCPEGMPEAVQEAVEQDVESGREEGTVYVTVDGIGDKVTIHWRRSR